MSSREHFSWQAAVYSTELPPMVKLVLGVISARMNQYGCGAFPSYKTIAKDASISPSTAKAAVKTAVEAGWLKKRARLKAVVLDGKPVISNDSNEYEIAFGGGPCDGPGVVREADEGGPCDGPGVVREADTNTPSEHPIEHTFANAQVAPAAPDKPTTKKLEKKPARVDFLPILIAEGVPAQVAIDFIAMRKEKRSSLSMTALEGIKREAAAAGYTLEMALRKCLDRGWIGFNSEWSGVKVPSGAAKPVSVNQLPKSYGESGRL